ncbi:MAG: hypothetical protein JKY56_23240 [Kofleriaceae bacterium]|nr:hypothetical protein [Kofleriaceae bacterium]
MLIAFAACMSAEGRPPEERPAPSAEDAGEDAGEDSLFLLLLLSADINAPEVWRRNEIREIQHTSLFPYLGKRSSAENDLSPARFRGTTQNKVIPRC